MFFSIFPFQKISTCHISVVMDFLNLGPPCKNLPDPPYFKACFVSILLLRTGSKFQTFITPRALVRLSSFFHTKCRMMISFKWCKKLSSKMNRYWVISCQSLKRARAQHVTHRPKMNFQSWFWWLKQYTIVFQWYLL